jgi:hypothetical protein
MPIQARRRWRLETTGNEVSIIPLTQRTGPCRLLRFDEIVVEQLTADTFACRVTLSGPGDRVYMGEGSSSMLGVPMTAAARATLRAIEVYAGARLTLESIRKTSVGDRELILVIVSAHPRQELTGAVVIRGDESKAAVLAVLDATNRWLENRKALGYSPS